MESVSASEDLEKQATFVPSLSPKSLEAQQCEETRPPEEGKRNAFHPISFHIS